MSTSVAHIIRRRRNRRARKQQAFTRRRSIGLALFFVLALLVIAPAGVVLGGGALLYLNAVGDLPTPQETIYLDPIIGPTRLYDRSGQTLLISVQDPLGDQRVWLTLDQLPAALVPATLLMEDRDFLQTAHFDPFGTLVRLWANAADGPDSSLTGRLVHNVIAPLPEVMTPAYRARELALVAEINRRYTPLQIVEWHLNTNYYGSEAYGIDAAARIYFGKRATELTLDEVALLATIPPAPQFNPWDDEIAARGRQSVLLNDLFTNGYITREEYEAASSVVTPVRRDTAQIAQIAPEFAALARRQAEGILDALGYDGAQEVARGGLQIITTLDVDLYYQADCALQTHLALLRGAAPPQAAANGAPCIGAAYLPSASPTQSDVPPDSGALVLLDVRTGEIRALVGDAAAANYAPGPTLHPFVYVDGFTTTLWTPATMVLDIPRQFPGAIEGLIYPPQNPDGLFRGPVSLRDAMAAGLLPPVVDIANQRGVRAMFVPARRMGIISLSDARYDLSLFERGGVVSPLEVAFAYSVFASQGDMRGLPVLPLAEGYRRHDPVAVLRIVDANGAVLWAYSGETYEPDCAVAQNCTAIFPRSLGYMVNSILSDNEARALVQGAAADVLALDRPAAAVSGMTGDRLFAWTVGYTPQMVSSVVLYRADGTALTPGAPTARDPWGLTAAPPVWRAVLEYAHARDTLPPAEWERPADVVALQVCEVSGQLPNGVCPVRDELFADVAVPAIVDSYWREVEVNVDTGQLATVNTPPAARARRVFFVPPPEAYDWWVANNLPLPPTELDTVSRPQVLGGAAITRPEPFTYVGGVVQVEGEINLPDLQYYQLSYGQGIELPDEWIGIGERVTTYTPGAPLGTWDTTGLDGVYNLRLQVVLQDNSVQTTSVQVTVDNVPPAITLAAQGGQTNTAGQVFRFPADSTILLNADVRDNLALDRVEFFQNGQPIGTDRDAPYGFTWTINRTGVEEFAAVAFDAVGNASSATLTIEVQRGN